jgi:hypothetical protein
MAADHASETDELPATAPQRRRTLIRRIPQLILVVFYSAACTIFTIEFFRTGTVTIRGRVLLAGLVSFMFLLASTHLVIFRLGLKVSRVVARPRPERS